MVWSYPRPGPLPPDRDHDLDWGRVKRSLEPSDEPLCKGEVCEVPTCKITLGPQKNGLEAYRDRG